MPWKPRKCKNKSESSNWLKPQYSPFQMWYSHNLFVNSYSNFDPRIKIWSFLDSARTGLLKNVQNQFSRCFGSWEISKTKVGTFCETPCMNMLFNCTLRSSSRTRWLVSFFSFSSRLSPLLLAGEVPPCSPACWGIWMRFYVQDHFLASGHFINTIF